ncbi:MAG: ribosome-associated translation inhibitor RaiA [Planctomycetota bacterium]
MEVRVTARNGEISQDIQQKISRKVSRLPRFFDRTTGIQVVCDMSHSSEPKVEIVVSAEETNDFFASATGTNVIAATDLAVDKVEQQLRKHKNKLIEHSRGRDRDAD